MKPRKAAVIFVLITVTLDMLTLGLIAPVLPKLVLDFMGGNAPNAAKMFGIFGTVWALMQFIFSPVLGVLSDRFGRRPVILLSNLGLGLDYVVMAMAPTLGWLFVGRVISGITAASISTGKPGGRARAAAFASGVGPARRHPVHRLRRARSLQCLGALHDFSLRLEGRNDRAVARARGRLFHCHFRRDGEAAGGAPRGKAN